MSPSVRSAAPLREDAPSPAPRAAPRLRVAQVCAESFLAGPARRLGLLIGGLRAAGVESVLVSTPSSRLSVLADELEVESHEVPLRGGLDVASLAALRRIFRRAGVDVVHVHGEHAVALARAGAFLSGLPLVVTYDEPARRGLFPRALVRGAVASTPEALADLHRARFRKDRVRAIPAPVDLARLERRADRELARAAENTGPDDVVFLSLSSIEAGRGHDVLLRALARLSEAGLRPLLWIAGDGPELVPLDELRRDLALTREAGFLGRRTDVGSLIHACDVVVEAGVVPRPGLGALEAMALGRPVVATAIGGAGEAVLDGKTGLVVPPGNPVALAEAMRSLLVDSALRHRLGAAGPARIEEGYRLHQVAERHVELYEDVAGVPSR